MANDLCEVYKYLNDLYKTDKNNMILYTVTAHPAREQPEAREAVTLIPYML